jgi:hypothetical protein
LAAATNTEHLTPNAKCRKPVGGGETNKKARHSPGLVGVKILSDALNAAGSQEA